MGWIRNNFNYNSNFNFQNITERKIKMVTWFQNNGTLITTILGFIYAAIEFYNQWSSSNPFDWKKFIPALVVFAIGYFIKVPKKENE